MYSPEIIAAILGFSGVIITRALVPLIAYWWQASRSRYQNYFKSTFHDFQETQSALEHIRNTTTADRAVILKTENNGGRPKVGTPIYSTVMYESSNIKTPTLGQRWEKQLIDSEYATILGALLSDAAGEIIIEVEGLEKDSLLKNLYLRDGIKRSKLFFISAKENYLVYLSINMTHGEPLEAFEKDIIREEVSKLQKIFNRNGD